MWQRNDIWARSPARAGAPREGENASVMRPTVMAGTMPGHDGWAHDGWAGVSASRYSQQIHTDAHSWQEATDCRRSLHPLRRVNPNDALIGRPDVVGDGLCIFSEIPRRDRDESDFPVLRYRLPNLR